jgi:hypothetical protein
LTLGLGPWRKAHPVLWHHARAKLGAIPEARLVIAALASIRPLPTARPGCADRIDSSPSLGGLDCANRITGSRRSSGRTRAKCVRQRSRNDVYCPPRSLARGMTRRARPATPQTTRRAHRMATRRAHPARSLQRIRIDAKRQGAMCYHCSCSGLLFYQFLAWRSHEFRPRRALLE